MTVPGKPVLDLLITAIETNSHHGVGILLQRMFPDSTEFVCLRSSSLHAGDEPFGMYHHELRSRGRSDAETGELLRHILSAYRIRRILAVPYYPEDFAHAFLAQRLTGAPLCTYLMDDQNVFASHVPDHRVADLLGVSDLRLGISPELCAAYEHKYRHRFGLLPPVLERPEPIVQCRWTPTGQQPSRCAMIGNIWTSARLTQLRQLLRETGLQVDWFGPGPFASWHDGKTAEWQRDNLHCGGFLPENELVSTLASYPFVLVPSGTAAPDDDNPAFSRLSLPSRLLFLHARTDTPALVLGSPKTAAGHFVTSLGTGHCAMPTPESLTAAIRTIVRPDRHRRTREIIRTIAPKLIMPGSGHWLWQSLAAHTALDTPFSSLFPPMNWLRRWHITRNIGRFSVIGPSC